MITTRKTARLVGALFLISNVTFIVGAIVFVEPILNAPDYLTLISANRAKIVFGVLLELSNAVAYVGIAALMFPILRQRFESMALGYFGFRIIEFVTQILTDLSPLKLLSLSEQFIGAGSPEATSFQTLGMLLIAERSWSFQMLSITFGVSALLFYIMLYQSKLIPRFLSIWGFVGAAMVLLNTMFDMFGISIVNLGILMLANELFLGVWLIAKGFNQPVSE
ncbi:MAG: DUF4386 domain-containing protein [Anaerolineales bacterium]|nr:DUF4386 domain-containing protein [Chloroflexota bacterium]MBL6981628.1 DUF4386 domain-containing protein [Anaerolineales bacterium]